MNKIELKSVCVIGERWPVMKFTGQLDDPRFKKELVKYEVGFSSRRLSINEAKNLTVISLAHYFLWDGSESDFQKWCRNIGGSEIANYLVEIINRLIDLVQSTFVESPKNPFPHIRHVGVRDFLLLDILYGPHRQNCISYSMPTLDAGMTQYSLSLVSKINFSATDDPLPEKIKILRAVELFNCGYRTESVLVAFSVLDSVVQKTLKSLLNDKGITDSEAYLRSIPTNRLSSYLGPLLKTLTGHSLKKDNQDLWNKLQDLNRHRNKAIHQSNDINWKNALQCIETVNEILSYLHSIKKTVLTTSPDYIMPSMAIDNLPILLK